MKVEHTTVAAIEAAAEFPALLAEYAAESAIDGMPSPQARMAQYRDLEARGVLRAIAATTEGGALAGFISVLLAPLPHYGIPVAVCESFFVAKAHRASLAGLKLLAAAEGLAGEANSPGLLVSAPYGGKLFELLPRCGYAETNRVFFKKMAASKAAFPAAAQAAIPPMTPSAIGRVARLEEESLRRDQVDLPTDHVLHAGLYARTVLVPAGTLFTGALVKIPTMLVVTGEAMVWTGNDKPLHLVGHNVVPAAAGRKQAFLAMSDMALTMIFATDAGTVDEAERAFTDEHERLASRRDPALNRELVMEASCPA